MINHHWLITGGCGFIGTKLVENLVQEGGHRITILDNLKVGRRDDLAAVCDFVEADIIATDASPEPGVRLCVGDIRDPETCLQAAENADVIVHLAANTGVAPSVEDPRADMENNVIGTLNMLEAARQNSAQRFVFASSGAPIGECRPPIHEELPAHPVSPYGASKLAGEGYCSAYFRTFGVETVMLRFGNVYGPGSGHKNSVVAKFIKQALSGETLEVYGDGAQTRDFIYIDDLINAIRLAQRTPDIGGEIFQIATNRETSVSEMVDILVPVLNSAGVADITIVNAAPRAGDVMRNFSDTSKAANKLNWTAQYDLARGLAETVKYFLRK